MPLERLTAVAPMETPKPEEVPEKTQAQIDVLKEKLLSASALKNYMDCPARFYYQSVQGLKSDDDVAESLDSRMLGNVFHHVMEDLYGRAKLITPQMIDAFRKDVKGLKALIRSKVLEEMHSIEVTGRNLVLEEIILDYVLSTLKHDAAILAATEGTKGFRIIGLEKHLFGSFKGFKLHGYIDRLDSYRDGEVRVVDYKTGKVEAEKGDPKIALQMFLYDILCHQEPSLAGKQLVNSIYSIRHIYTGSLPDMPEDPEKTKEMTAQLEAMLSDITNLDIPWSRTEDKDICAHCDFKDICGR